MTFSSPSDKFHNEIIVREDLRSIPEIGQVDKGTKILSSSAGILFLLLPRRLGDRAHQILSNNIPVVESILA